MKANSQVRGLTYAIISASAFGMLGLFSVPCLRAGMSTLSIVFYRFVIGSIAMLAIVLWGRRNMRITKRDFWQIMLLAASNNFSAYTMILGYNYMSSGAAQTIQFSYPIFTCLIMILFFHERLTWRIALSIALAVVGVGCISGTGDMSQFPIKGVSIELASGLIYAIYLVMIPMMRINRLDSSVLTFYIFLFSALQWLFISPFTGGFGAIPSWSIGGSLIMMGLVPTVLSNFALVLALKSVGSTLSSICGAMEPVTAMLCGAIAFGEPVTAVVMVGFVAIVTSVMLLIVKPVTACER
ncbi:MAG: DMT family transporter [Muribaculaceae bacterium]|nr:DMT family transporter [Muribaculaceae bacterium]